MKFTDLVRKNPTLISDAIEGANAAMAAGTGEERADLATATVISTAGALFPQYAEFEGLAYQGLQMLIKVVYNHKKSATQPVTPSAATVIGTTPAAK